MSGMNRLKPKLTVLFVIAVFFFASCSSVPKRPAEVFTIQSMTDTLIGQANMEADQGNYTEALNYLNEAWRLAVTTDRPALRIRVNLGRANALYALGRTEEAERIWRTAEIEANFNEEPMLASASRVFRSRSLLISGKMNPEEVLTLVQDEQNNLKKDKLFFALSWTVKGMAEKELGRFTDAEKSIMNALSIHEKERYLEQAAYDWYLIASVRSVAGNYQQAIDALNRAIGFDRRAENTFGLAMDWAAMGDVFTKMGNDGPANMSWRRSAEIFRAMDKGTHAQEVESRIKPINRDETARSPRSRNREVTNN
jgi:tetratricopeptide (TPR) repeat protein